MSFSTGIVSLSHSHVLQNSCAVINESLTLFFFLFVPNVFIFFSKTRRKDLDQLLLVSNEEEKFKREKYLRDLTSGQVEYIRNKQTGLSCFIFEIFDRIKKKDYFFYSAIIFPRLYPPPKKI